MDSTEEPELYAATRSPLNLRERRLWAPHPRSFPLPLSAPRLGALACDHNHYPDGIILLPPIQFPVRPPLLFPAPPMIQWDPTPSMGSWGSLAPMARRGNVMKVGRREEAWLPLCMLCPWTQSSGFGPASQLLCCEITFSSKAQVPPLPCWLLERGENLCILGPGCFPSGSP